MTRLTRTFPLGQPAWLAGPVGAAALMMATVFLAGCSSVGYGVGIGIPTGIPGVSIGVGVGSGGVNAGVSAGSGPVRAGVGVNQGGQVSAGVGVGASTNVGGGVSVGGGVGTSTVIYDPDKDKLKH